MTRRSFMVVGAAAGRGCLARNGGNWAFPEPVASWDEAEKDRQRSAARRLAADLRAAIAAGAAEFEVPPGDYRFDTDALPNLRLDRVRDLAIAAHGATFWFHGRRRIDGVSINGCTGLALRGLTIDYDPCPYSQGEVIAIDRAARTVDIRIDPGFPLPDESWTAQAGSIKAIFFGSDGLMRDFRLDWVAGLEPLGGDQYRVTFQQNWIFVYNDALEQGDRLALPDRSLRHAVNIDSSERVALEDVTIHAAPHMAMVETRGAGGNHYRGCRVVVRPGSRRLLASNADVFHSIKVAKGPTIEDCEFAGAGDDFVNIHSLYSTVLERRGPAEAVIGVCFEREIAEGSELVFYDRNGSVRRGVRRAAAVTDTTDERWVSMIKAIPADLRAQGLRATDFIGSQFYALLVRLDEALNVEKYDLVETYERTGAGAVIRNNRMRDAITRGLVIKGEDVLIENNRIERTGLPGILVANDPYFWEGPAPRRITIRGNRLEDCALNLNARNWLNGYQAAISIWASDRVNAPAKRVTHNSQITVEGNEIVRPPVSGIFIAGTRDSTVARNSIDTPAARAPHPAANGFVLAAAYAIYVADSENVAVEENTVTNHSPYCRGDVGRGLLP